MSEGDLRWRPDQVWPDNIIILVNEAHSLCVPVQLSATWLNNNDGRGQAVLLNS